VKGFASLSCWFWRVVSHFIIYSKLFFLKQKLLFTQIFWLTSFSRTFYPVVCLNYTIGIWTQTCSNTIMKWAILPQYRTRNLFNWYTWRREKVRCRIIRRSYFRKLLWKKLNPITSLVLSLNSWANTKPFVYWMSFLSTELIDSWCVLRRYGSIGMFRSQVFHFQTKRFSGYEFGSTDRAVNSAALVSHISADANTKLDETFESVWNWRPCWCGICRWQQTQRKQCRHAKKYNYRQMERTYACEENTRRENMTKKI